MSKTVIVTGGSRGLGQKIVESFLDRGCNVATLSRSATSFIETMEAEQSEKFFYAPVDLSDREATASYVKEVADQFGTVDVLVNNAGVARDDVLALESDQDADLMVDVNLKGTLGITRECVRRMLTQRSGCVINITSIVGQSGYRGLSVYSMTKAGLDGLTRSLARELGGRGIRVNSVAPGFLETEMTHGLDDEQRSQIERRTPMGRLGRPKDVVGIVQFLASPKAEFITGQTIVVDGGITA